jgi:hypothetical protein
LKKEEELARSGRATGGMGKDDAPKPDAGSTGLFRPCQRPS